MADYTAVYQSGLLPMTKRVSSKPDFSLITGNPQPVPLSFGSFSPAAGTTIIGATTLHFVITGVLDSRLGIALAVRVDGSLTPELVYDGNAFTPMYGAGSSYVVNGNMAAVTLVRAGGWPAAPTLSAFTLYTV